MTGEGEYGNKSTPFSKPRGVAPSDNINFCVPLSGRSVAVAMAHPPCEVF